MTDSQSCIDVIQSFGKTKISEQRINFLDKDILFSIYNEQKRVGKCQILWVPSHVGIPGNEAADQKAKQAIRDKTINCALPTPNDNFAILYQHDQPRGSPKDFVADIIERKYRSRNVDTYEILSNQYHVHSVMPNNLPANKQVFHARARTNTLATRSKMEKWFNENSICPRCFTEHEDQLHLVVGCKENHTYTQKLVQQFVRLAQKEQNNNHTANKDVRIPGTSIYYNQHQTFAKDKYIDEYKIYKERLGLLTHQYINKLTQRTYPRKPSRFTRNITTMLLNITQEIWYDRCTANAAIPKDALGVGQKCQ
jgi:hypothetical protein